MSTDIAGRGIRRVWNDDTDQRRIGEKSARDGTSQSVDEQLVGERQRLRSQLRPEDVSNRERNDENSGGYHRRHATARGRVARHRIERRDHFCRASVSFGRRLRQETRDNADDGPRNARRQRWHPRLENRAMTSSGPPLKAQLPRQHLVEHDAKRPEIRALIGELAAQYFRATCTAASLQPTSQVPRLRCA